MKFSRAAPLSQPGKTAEQRGLSSRNQRYGQSRSVSPDPRRPAREHVVGGVRSLRHRKPAIAASVRVGDATANSGSPELAARRRSTIAASQLATNGVSRTPHQSDRLACVWHRAIEEGAARVRPTSSASRAARALRPSSRRRCCRWRRGHRGRRRRPRTGRREARRCGCRRRRSARHPVRAGSRSRADARAT